MKLVEAKATARRLWPRLTLSFGREGNVCVLREGGEEFGRGGSWLAALRDGALRFSNCADVAALETKAAAEMK